MPQPDEHDPVSIRLPSLRVPGDIELTETGGAVSTRGKRPDPPPPAGKRAIIVSSGAVATMGAVAIAYFQAQGPRTPDPAPVARAEVEALQESLDAAYVRITALEGMVEYNYQWLCAVNGGSPGSTMTESHCDPNYFRENRTPPPMFKTDRVRGAQ